MLGNLKRAGKRNRLRDQLKVDKSWGICEFLRAMSHTPPEKPENSYRVTLTLNHRQPRLDVLLLEALRGQEECQALKRVSRTTFKALFNDKKIVIKGQPAKPSSSVAAGVTYIDILGYANDE